MKQVHFLHRNELKLGHESAYKDKDKEEKYLFIGPQEFVVVYSKAPE